MLDRFDCYELCVQSPRHVAGFLHAVHANEPQILREDFCGTATLSAHWARSHRERWAVGVDLDGPTLRWGERRHLQSVEPALRRRVTLIEGNVLDGLGPDNYTSMAQDALAGRPTEVDSFAGTVVELGRRTGVPVPVNTVLYGLLKGQEAVAAAVATRG